MEWLDFSKNWPFILGFAAAVYALHLLERMVRVLRAINLNLLLLRQLQGDESAQEVIQNVLKDNRRRFFGP
jgi:hypothetical protein